MNMNKVKVTCWWDSDYNIFNIFRDIWYNDDISKEMLLTYRDDYDYLIILNDFRRNKNEIKCPIENRIAFIMEPSWSNNWDRNLSDYVSKVYSHFEYDEKFKFNPSIMSTHLYPKPIEIGEIQHVENNVIKITNTKYEKSKKLSIVVSNISSYKRYEFVKKLLNSDLEFDMYGRGWNINDSRYKGYVTNKIDALKDYEFSICLENSVEYGYISEKFIDSILCETIPIYYGSSDVDKWYGKCFEHIDIESINSIDELKYILNKKQEKQEYDFSKAKNFYLNENNPFKILLNYIKNKNNQ